VAAEAIIKVASCTDSVDVMEVLGGMYLAQEQGPYRFVSDRHYWFQLARRFRSLGDTLTATRWDGRANNGTGKLRKLYKDLTPRGVDALAKWLVEALGGAGMNIAQSIEADEKAVLAKSQAYFESFASIRTTQPIQTVAGAQPQGI
jgi:hypothetical protein